jgi:hypothetical protein
MSLDPKVEELLVRDLGKRIGFGRIMQLCEQLWKESHNENGFYGSELTVGPCAAFMVKCEHLEVDDNGHCNLCYGGERIPKRLTEIAKFYLSIT